MPRPHRARTAPLSPARAGEGLANIQLDCGPRRSQRARGRLHTVSTRDAWRRCPCPPSALRAEGAGPPHRSPWTLCTPRAGPVSSTFLCFSRRIRRRATPTQIPKLENQRLERSRLKQLNSSDLRSPLNGSTPGREERWQRVNRILTYLVLTLGAQKSAPNSRRVRHLSLDLVLHVQQDHFQHQDQKVRRRHPDLGVREVPG